MLSSLARKFPVAILALADGHFFIGHSVGAHGTASGELVFNTAMAGYQEILTNPVYRGQIVTFTYPHIGNCGTNPEDAESAVVHAAGVVIRDLPQLHSNFRAQQGLGEYLVSQGTVAIAGVDTRHITRILRRAGVQGAALLALPAGEEPGQARMDEALAMARATPGLAGQDLAGAVTTRKPYEWTQTSWVPGQGFGRQDQPRFKVVVCDFGVRRSVLQLLASRGCSLTVMPATAGAAEILAQKPDGIYLSGGPGDPAACADAIATVRELLASGLPMFGLGLGHQLLALAAGAQVRKLVHNHRGVSHPVRDLESGHVSLTAQDHGFAVEDSPLPDALLATHRSLFDGTLQGLRQRDGKAFSFQGLPEQAAGDRGDLFGRFIGLMEGAGA